MRFFTTLFTGLLLLIATDALAQNAAAGRTLYLGDCFNCHGFPPDGAARKAANNPAILTQAFTTIPQMRFLNGVFTPAQIADIAAFVGNPNVTPSTNVTLTITLTGGAAGSVTSSPQGVNCGAVCSTSFAAGSQVTLTATPVKGSRFTGWSGCGGAATCQITLNADQTVSANFAPVDYTDLWWAGQAENGWGMAITQHSPSNIQFNAFYVYEADGKPTWYVMPFGTWSNNFTVYTGALYRPTGSRLDNFVTGNIAVGASVGNATITFADSANATFAYTINGVSATKNIVRQPFGPADSTPGLQVADLWWGGDPQSGWGISISQQFRTLFAAWYTYGTECAGANSGCKATWFVMPGGAWGSGVSANTYTGAIYATTGSPWLGTSYDPAKLGVLEVGTLTIAFTPDTAGATAGRASNASLTYRFTAGPFAGTTQTKQITRQPY